MELIRQKRLFRAQAFGEKGTGAFAYLQGCFRQLSQPDAARLLESTFADAYGCLLADQKVGQRILERINFHASSCKGPVPEVAVSLLGRRIATALSCITFSDGAIFRLQQGNTRIDLPDKTSAVCRADGRWEVGAWDGTMKDFFFTREMVKEKLQLPCGANVTAESLVKFFNEMQENKVEKARESSGGSLAPTSQHSSTAHTCDACSWQL